MRFWNALQSARRAPHKRDLQRMSKILCVFACYELSIWCDRNGGRGEIISEV